MPRIVHIAIKVDDLEKATKFYEEVFAFRQTSTGYARGHVSSALKFRAPDGTVAEIVGVGRYNKKKAEKAPA